MSQLSGKGDAVFDLLSFGNVHEIDVHLSWKTGPLCWCGDSESQAGHSFAAFSSCP